VNEWLARIVFGIGCGSVLGIFMSAVLGSNTVTFLGIAGLSVFLVLVLVSVLTSRRMIPTLEEVFGRRQGS